MYGVVRPGMAMAPAPRGLDGAPVMLEPGPGAAPAVDLPMAALVSRVDPAAYTPTVVETRVGDMEWVGPRAEAHDAVLTWASEQNAVVPFPMFTLYASAESLHEMLRERGAALDALLRRVAHADEWSVRLFRLDDAMAAALEEWSPAMAELARQAAAATPGQRYLLERKADEQRGAELLRLSAEAASESFAALSAHADAAVRDALPAARMQERQAGAAILDAAFLVHRDRGTGFREVVAELARTLEPRGLRIALSGPWPPYHFVREPS
ncbi:MAG: GvpL/GvpF family gas vesicle protein [Gemmatimonadaceae bacterium]